MSERRFERIVDDIRDRIELGQLQPGERVPSARQITRQWGVAMATATRALATLADDGLVSARPGVGTVVAARTRRRPLRARTSERDLTLQTIIATSISIADGEGLAAVSMRRIAIELGVATMALYRHVRGKNSLLLLMADTVLGEAPPPAERPVGGRAQLELLGRLQWRIYERHPWLARLLSMTRPSAMPNGMAHTEWALQAVKTVGLDPGTALHVVVALFGYVRGSAMNLEMQAEAEQETGLTDDEWMASQQAALTKSLASGRYPALLAVAATPVDITPDTLFEFGLQRMLDGLGPFL